MASRIFWTSALAPTTPADPIIGSSGNYTGNGTNSESWDIDGLAGETWNLRYGWTNGNSMIEGSDSYEFVSCCLDPGPPPDAAYYIDSGQNGYITEAEACADAACPGGPIVSYNDPGAGGAIRYMCESEFDYGITLALNWGPYGYTPGPTDGCEWVGNFLTPGGSTSDISVLDANMVTCRDDQSVLNIPNVTKGPAVCPEWTLFASSAGHQGTINYTLPTSSTNTYKLVYTAQGYNVVGAWVVLQDFDSIITGTGFFNGPIDYVLDNIAEYADFIDTSGSCGVGSDGRGYELYYLV